MDVQRILLLVATTLITYMLVLQWNADYGQPAAAPEAPVTSVSAYNSSPANAELPAGEVAQAANDLPIERSAQTSASAKLIEITTDVLKLTVDTKGGDIIQLALPEIKAAMGSDQPFVLLEQNTNRTYVAQSGLVGANGPDAAQEGRPTYAVSADAFTMGDEDTLAVDLVFVNKDGVKVTKRYSFERGSYNVGLEYIVENTTASPWRASLFGQIKRDSSEDPTTSLDFAMASYLGAVYSTEENTYEKVDFDDMDDKDFSASSKSGYVGFLQHYFVSAWIPQPNVESRFQSRKVNGNYLMGFTSPEFTVAPNAT
ncbi:MAG: membrane protein insertase YidC, partial [Pontibacterium sp.]